MKNLTAMLTALAMLSCCLVSCGGDSGNGDNKSSNNTSSSSQVEEETEPADTEPAQEKALRKFIETINDSNTKDFIRFILPQAIIDITPQENYDVFFASIEDSFSSGETKETIKLCEIVSDTELPEKYLGYAKNYFLDESYALFTYDDDYEKIYDCDFTVSEGYEIECKMERYEDDELAGDYTETICLFRIEDDGWKVFIAPADELDSYDNSGFDDKHDPDTTTAVTTATAVTTQPTTAAPVQVTPPTVSTDYSIPNSAFLDFTSLVFGFTTLGINDEFDYVTCGVSILPKTLYEKIENLSMLTDYNKKITPYINKLHASFSQNSDDYLSVDTASNTKLLTAEELGTVKQYYYDVMAAYGITDVQLDLIGGYSADVYIKTDISATDSKPVRMICVTDSTGDASALPCDIDGLKNLYPWNER